ncbi:MAG: aldo/keto reductase [Cyanobacteria bacterium SID2]|nr:aldo/keto reductase [Cyanobacteria bacterium SID2]MBP0004379.1 aldo/keto reductase [Cyanobacteria bacterium SBC]
MEYRRFGRTELKMPVFSCGGMRYQHSWKDVPPSEISEDNQRNLEATIRRSIELGINHIETARGYGTSEIQLGRILPQFPRDELIVQTKVSPTEDPLEFRLTLKQSLQNLQLDRVDLLGIHGINTPELLEYTLRPGGCLEEAQKFQKQGRVRYIGFSTHGPTEVILQAIESGAFDYVNLHWYYINQINWPAIEAARRHDMGVFIISPSNKGGMLYEPSPKLVELCRPLSPIVFNNLFCLSRSEVHTLSLGAARPSDFDEHLKALPLLDREASPKENRADKLLPEILDRLEKAAIEALGEQWYKTWHQGLPNFDETPREINIPVILWLRNLAVAYDLVEYGKMRYNLLGNGSHWFPGQRAEKIDDRSLQSCLKNSPHAEIIPDILRETHEMLGDRQVKRLSQQ